MHSVEKWSLGDVSMAHSNVRYQISQLLTEKKLTDSQSERMQKLPLMTSGKDLLEIKKPTV